MITFSATLTLRSQAHIDALVNALELGLDAAISQLEGDPDLSDRDWDQLANEARATRELLSSIVDRAPGKIPTVPTHRKKG